MFSLLILPGDGIGPEVMTEVKRVISWFQDKRGLKINIEEGLVGGASYDKHGIPLTEEMLKKALEVDAVLLGAVGGPDYDNLSFDLKPERALLKPRNHTLNFGHNLWTNSISWKNKQSKHQLYPFKPS